MYESYLEKKKIIIFLIFFYFLKLGNGSLHSQRNY